MNQNNRRIETRDNRKAFYAKFLISIYSFLLQLLGGFSSLVGLEPIRYAIGLEVSNPAIIGLGSLLLSLLLMIFGSLFFPDKKQNLYNA